jgi:hypothetical protein
MAEEERYESCDEEEELSQAAAQRGNAVNLTGTYAGGTGSSGYSPGQSDPATGQSDPATVASAIRDQYNLGDGRLPEIASALKAHVWDILKAHGHGCDEEEPGVYGTYKIGSELLRGIFINLLVNITQAEQQAIENAIPASPAISQGKVVRILEQFEQFRQPGYHAEPAPVVAPPRSPPRHADSAPLPHADSAPLPRTGDLSRPTMEQIQTLMNDGRQFYDSRMFQDLDNHCATYFMRLVLDEQVRTSIISCGAVAFLMDFIGVDPANANIPKEYALRSLRNMLDSEEAHTKLRADQGKLIAFNLGLKHLLHRRVDDQVVAAQTMEKIANNRETLNMCVGVGLFDDMVKTQLKSLESSQRRDLAKAQQAAKNTLVMLPST